MCAEASGIGGEKEGYFFCKRGRKYRNSIRPNRVTGSGFWKATGIDKPVYSHGGEGNDCIGLKKTLVYYRGSAGKGTKTDWMMHEFRLPSNSDTNTNHANTKNNADIAQEAVSNFDNTNSCYTLNISLLTLAETNYIPSIIYNFLLDSHYFSIKWGHHIQHHLI